MRELGCSEVVEQMLIERYVAGRLEGQEVEALESHYLLCPRCYESLRLAVGIRTAVSGKADVSWNPRELASGVDAAGRSGRRWVGGAAGLALAAVLATVVLLRPVDLGEATGPVHRDEAARTVEAVPETPVGRVDPPSEFHWSAVDGADLYRVTLYDAGGGIVWETETRETRAGRPEETVLTPGQPYLWGVSARVDWNRWVPSDLVEFVVREEGEG